MKSVREIYLYKTMNVLFIHVESDRGSYNKTMNI